jgi:hypothetical protein
VIISIDEEKAFNKIHLFKIKALKKLRRNALQYNKGYMQYIYNQHHTWWRKTETSSSKPGTR